MMHPKHDELVEFLYDELEPARRAELQRHLDRCEPCRAQVASWNGVRATLASSDPASGLATRPSVQHAAGASSGRDVLHRISFYSIAGVMLWFERNRLSGS